MSAFIVAGGKTITSVARHRLPALSAAA